MATRLRVAILGRGEFCKVVGEGLFTRIILSGTSIFAPVCRLYTKMEKIFLHLAQFSVNKYGKHRDKVLKVG